MNKLILFGLLVLLFNSIDGQFYCQNFATLGFKDEDLDEEVCSLLTPTDKGATHCCYREINGSPSCVQLTDDQYENIGRYIKFEEDRLEAAGEGDFDIDIDCSSKFLSLSLFVVFALLF